MNPTHRSPIVVRCLGASLGLLLPLLFQPLVMYGQLTSSGFSVSNPEWQILVTHYGYADLALDRRPGFVGREYLSGEWAAAVHYTGGSNPTNAIWFQPQWFFPDWVSDSNFGVQTNFNAIGVNADGFTIYRSVITNNDLRVTMTYEMLDTTNGIAMGTTKKSAGGVGSSVLSSRYVFRQTYRITNLSGVALTNFKFYQFLHGLNMTNSLYDDRLYASGAMTSYQYDITQQGQSYGFDSRTGEIVRHTDIMAFHSKVMPATWENGYYGRKDVDSHVIGKPGVGVHWSVETNSLNNLDFFTPPETLWVSGAQCFTNGTLAAGATLTNDVLLSLKSTYVVSFAGVNIVYRGVTKSGNNLNIDFQETIGGPVGFLLLKSTNVALPMAQWESLALPYTLNFPQAGWNRFQVPISPNEPRAFFRIQALIQN